MVEPEYGAKSCGHSVQIRFHRKVISQKSKKDPDAKLYYINGGAQKWKFNYIKIFLRGNISGSTQEKIYPHAKPFQRAGGYWIGFLKIHPHTKSS